MGLMAVFFLQRIPTRGVTCRVSSRNFPRYAAARQLVALIALAGAFLVSTTAHGAIREIPAPSFAQMKAPAPKPPPKPAAGSAQTAAEQPALDQLVFKDGDRVRGRLLEHDGDVLVFRSERFGVVRVPAAEADVILAKPPQEAVAAAPDQSAAVAEKVEEGEVEVERWPFSPLAFTQALREFFGSWHGRFTVSSEVLEDARDHSSATVDAKLRRKWKQDEVEVSGRYDYASVNESTATDVIKGDAVWRHDFPNRLFAVYRATLEWNRQFYRSGVPADYVLLQQQVGAGVNIFNTDTRKLRAGVAENVFDTWVTPMASHTTQAVESLFAEMEAKLPWRITVTNRGVWYYSFASQTDGWENRFEIAKKLTETLTVGARHEVRRNNPDVRSADYERLRVLFGFDF